MIKEGKGNIRVEVIADSEDETTGKRITTFVLDYHRYIHAEVMTHRVFSRNGASTRAIPLSAAIQQVLDNPAVPIHWGAKQSGMSASKECTNEVLVSMGSGRRLKLEREEAWHLAMLNAIDSVHAYDVAGYHKQFAGRLLEPFQMMRVVVTSTSFDNWYWLRKDAEAAQPEIVELAGLMYEAMAESVPEVLKAGEWHTPFVWHSRNSDGELGYHIGVIGDEDCQQLTLEEAKIVSSARCAAVSYRKDGLYGLDKSIEVWDRLIKSTRVHGSAFEHCATPIAPSYESCYDEDKPFTYLATSANIPTFPITWEEGVTHTKRDGTLCSGNFEGWIQLRQLIPNQVCIDFEGMSND